MRQKLEHHCLLAGHPRNQEYENREIENKIAETLQANLENELITIMGN